MHGVHLIPLWDSFMVRHGPLAKDTQEDAVELLKSIFFFGKMTGMSGASILWDRPQAEHLHALPPQEANLEKHI